MKSKEESGTLAGICFLAIILITLVLLLASCEKPKGCGIVTGGGYTETSSNVNYYLMVRFGDSAGSRRVDVDYKTFIDFRVGEEVCFQ